MANKIKLAPNIFEYPDFEHSELHMEISLGGVNRDDIVLKMHDDGFYLYAPRDDFDYATSKALCCPVKASEAKAEFENGMLKVIVPFKGIIDEGVQIQII